MRQRYVYHSQTSILFLAFVTLFEGLCRLSMRSSKVLKPCSSGCIPGVWICRLGQQHVAETLWSLQREVSKHLAQYISWYTLHSISFGLHLKWLCMLVSL